MTGIPEWNFPAFQDAAEQLREAGFEVQSPHEFDLEDGFDPGSHGADFDLRAALERDVEAVLEADGVALLDGWEASPGVAVEILTAASQGKPARGVKEWLAGLVAVVAAVVGFGVAPAFSTTEPVSGLHAARQQWSALQHERERLERRIDVLQRTPQTEPVKREKRHLKKRLERLERIAP
jgi:hypothetical protein